MWIVTPIRIGKVAMCPHQGNAGDMIDEEKKSIRDVYIFDNMSKHAFRLHRCIIYIWSTEFTVLFSCFQTCFCFCVICWNFSNFDASVLYVFLPSSLVTPICSFFFLDDCGLLVIDETEKKVGIKYNKRYEREIGGWVVKWRLGVKLLNVSVICNY